MRRRLMLTALAVTSMVVVAFVVPLALLVRNLAHDGALIEAERDAESVARYLSTVSSAEGIERGISTLGLETVSSYDTSVVLADGTVIGPALRPGETVTAAESGSTVRLAVDGGEVVQIPVVATTGTLVVRVFVPDDALTEGVRTAWVTLAGLGTVLVVIAVVVFDRLARIIVDSVQALSDRARSLSEGDMSARVTPAGPSEIHDVGMEFNRLADRIDHLLRTEREQAADLSHRLRTPLTALRLDAEALPEDSSRRRILDDIDELSRHVDFVIAEARREGRRQPHRREDLTALTRARLEFWSALAEEQGRPTRAVLPRGPLAAPVAPEEFDAMFDALVGNIFAHTAEGVGFSVTLDDARGHPRLRIEDAGDGFPAPTVVERGTSTGASTGLGLDIARRTMESIGGTFGIGRSQALGGALVELEFPAAG